MNEIRVTKDNDTQLRYDGSRKISGYAIVFESESVPLRCAQGFFTEILKRGCITQELCDKSDVLFLLDHSTNNAVIARSNHGKGSMTLKVDETGVWFETELPETEKANEILESIRRGDLSKCSFAFQAYPKDCKIIKGGSSYDGMMLREIYKVSALSDISLVWHPAYENTCVQIDEKRFAQCLSLYESNDNRNDMNENEKEVEQQETEQPQNEENKPQDAEQETEQPTEGEKVDESKEPEQEEKDCGEQPDTKREDDEPESKEPEQETEQQPEQPEEKETDKETAEGKEQPESDDNKVNERSKTTMKKKFSLIGAIRSVAENRSLDEGTKQVIDAARNEMRSAGLAVDGQIVLPIENRAEGDAVNPTQGVFAATVAKQGKENVQTDVMPILEPLRAALVLGNCGATVLTNLRGDVEIPRLSKTNAFWKGEAVATDNGGAEFDSVVLKPRRISAFIEISKQLLMQSENSNIDAVITNDLIAALAEKIDATVFGTEAGSATQPEGLFNGVTANTAAIKYADVVAAEGEIEAKNVKDYKYILSPSAKATLRSTEISANTARFIFESDEVLGREAIVSANVTPKGMLLIDPRDLVYGVWGGISLTVDPYSQATRDVVRVVANMYVDAKMRREESVVAKILK